MALHIKGCFWILVGAVTITVLVALAFRYATKEYIWCDDGLNAGHCELYPTDQTCYCIDENTEDLRDKETVELNDQPYIGIYEHSNSQCQARNGTLAAPDGKTLLIWLSKRMYFQGIGRAYIGLHKIDSKWYWMKKNGPELARFFTWRPGFLPDDQHTVAAITVETIEIEDDLIENGFLYYNYDHYIENDKDYPWYGFKTATNDHKEDFERHIHFICRYDELSMIKQIVASQGDATTTHKSEVLDVEDECFCSNNEQVLIMDLNESFDFMSPGYPKNYCSDNNCRWIVTTDNELVIKLEWFVFSTEKGYDYVYVHDGGRSDDAVVAECTGSSCAEVLSSSSTMHIHFSADHVTTDIGFKGRVTAVKNDKCYCNPSVKKMFANLGDSFAFNTPNHPNPYCVNQNCSWVICAPQYTGVSIVWKTIDLENTDFLYIHDGKTSQDPLLQQCTNTDCSAVVSSAEDIYINFISDGHETSHRGFSAVATSAINYCGNESSELEAVGGTISFDKQRGDGHIPIRSTAKLTCDQNFKIQGTIDTTTEQSTCLDGGWRQFEKTCVPICPIVKETVSSSDKTLNLCKVKNTKDMTYVDVGQVLMLSKYDRENGQLISHHLYACVEGAEWYPGTPPICHTNMGILRIHGFYHNSTALAAVGETGFSPDDIQLYSPLEQISRTLHIKNHEKLPGAVSIPLDDLKILIVYKSKTDIIDLNSCTSKRGPEMSIARISPGTALLDTQVYVCGGFVIGKLQPLHSCETLQDGVWKGIADMPIGRRDFPLLALHHCLYAISGGDGHFDGEDPYSAHKYCPDQSDQWFVIPSPKENRLGFVGTVFEDKIIVCGGVSELDALITKSCEQYDTTENLWQPFADMNVQRYFHSLLVLEGKLMVIGGYKHFAEFLENDIQLEENRLVAKSIETYDPKVDKWMPTVQTVNEMILSSNIPVPLMNTCAWYKEFSGSRHVKQVEQDTQQGGIEEAIANEEVSSLLSGADQFIDYFNQYFEKKNGEEG